MADLIREPPLGHVHKMFRKANSPSLEVLKLLQALFEADPEAKAIVVASTTALVEELARSWRSHFKVIWMHGKLNHLEKKSRTQMFITDQDTRVLVGTKLVTAGIDIKALKMVIVIDNRTNIIEFIQGAGRLRGGGICCLLSHTHRGGAAVYNRAGELPPIQERCLTQQVRVFYGLKLGTGDNDYRHCGCCDSKESLSGETLELIEKFEKAWKGQAAAAEEAAAAEAAASAAASIAAAAASAAVSGVMAAGATSAAGIAVAASSSSSQTSGSRSNVSANVNANANANANANTSGSGGGGGGEQEPANESRRRQADDESPVEVERKRLKTQFQSSFGRMNLFRLLGFRDEDIKFLFLYGIDIHFCPSGVFTEYDVCKGCQKRLELCVCLRYQQVSYWRMAWEALAVERMLRNDQEYEKHLKEIEPYYKDPVKYLKQFGARKDQIYIELLRKYMVPRHSQR